MARRAGQARVGAAPGVAPRSDGPEARGGLCEGGTRVVREERRAVDIPAGDSLVGQVLEYDHFAEEARPVYD
ncbi:MAG: hypothetical protein LC800_06710 [Acidobacteria bacterium]|nr:hypothetical protein [Acidobacteriota bacterium]